MTGVDESQQPLAEDSGVWLHRPSLAPLQLFRNSLYVAANRVVYVVKQVLWLVPSALMIVLFLVLAVALWQVDKSFALIAGVIGVVSWAGPFAVSLVFLIWAVFCVQRTHGGQVLILVSVLQFLVGGGFGLPLLCIALGLTATRLHAPLI